MTSESPTAPQPAGATPLRGGGHGTDADHPRRRLRFTLGRKIQLALAVPAALLATLCLLVHWMLAGVRMDAARLNQESRDLSTARELRTLMAEVGGELELLPRLVSPDARALTRSRILALVARTREMVRELRQGVVTESSRRGEVVRRMEDFLAEAEQAEDRLQAGGQDATQMAPTFTSLDLAARDVVEDARRESTEVLEDAERSLSRVDRLTLAMTAVSALVMVGVAWFVSRKILQPIHALRAGSERIGAGDLGHRIDLPPGDEVGELAQAFNRMTASLEQSHRELERRIEERTRQLIQAARLADLGTLAAGLAHEINNPLASIASCAEGLGRRVRHGEQDQAEFEEDLATIAREAYRAHETTARMLAFARQGQSPMGDMSLAEVVADSTRLLRHNLLQKGITLKVEQQDDLPPIHGNAAELKQVLINLLTNARDSSLPGTTVTVRAYAADAAAVLEVDDQGSGIAPEHLDRIFDPFFTTKAPGHGTGLGLSIAFRIVEGHGGTIAAANRSEGGTRFRVSLPLAPPEREPHEPAT